MAGGSDQLQQMQEKAATTYPSGCGLYFGMHGGVSFINRVQLKTGFDVGGQVGYRFKQNFRTELAFTYLKHEGKTFSGNLNTYPLMANAIYDFHPTPSIVPFVGLGLGLAHLSVNRANPDNRDRFAYQAIAGIGYVVMPNTVLSFRYRSGPSRRVNSRLSDSRGWGMTPQRVLGYLAVHHRLHSTLGYLSPNTFEAQALS